MSARNRFAYLCLASLSACAEANVPVVARDQPPVDGGCPAQARRDAFVSCVDSFQPAPGVSFGHDAMPEIVQGAPRATMGGGSVDVASLGCGGTITLGFVDGIPNGDDADFIVFENAFAFGDDVFAEPAQVFVSEDGVTWFALGCDSPADDTDGCAGVTPTLATDARTAVLPTQAGGDAFDLDQVDLGRANWIRLVDRTREHYGDETWCTGAAGGFDLDAIARIHAP